MRHATELREIIREDFCNDEVAMDKPVLVLFTDGGPNHRTTFETVQFSPLCLFIQLDLDMIVALHTAPYNSWMNPAERAMSVLNLSLQHCALDRKPTSEEAKM